jgi:NADH-quinone oxidoreductase subunit J
MIIYNILFYVFALLALSSAVAVISVRNSVHAVFFLIFTFFNIAGIFILLGAEFLAMALVIVYVGAVAVLFLFVVMMLNVGLMNIKEYVAKHRYFLIIMSALFAVELIYVMYNSLTVVPEMLPAKIPVDIDGATTNTHQLGMVLYTNYALLFQISGFILFTAIIGAIALTHRKSNKIKRIQNPSEQIARDRDSSIRMVKPQLNEGIDVNRS